MLANTCSGSEWATPGLGCKDQEYVMLSLRPACALVVYLFACVWFDGMRFYHAKWFNVGEFGRPRLHVCRKNLP